MIVALASPRVATDLDDGLEKVRRLLAEASARGAEVACFPEAYLPGLRGQDFEVFPFDQADHERMLRAVTGWAREYALAVILGTERLTDQLARPLCAPNPALPAAFQFQPPPACL